MQLSNSIIGMSQPLQHLLPLVRDAGCVAVELAAAQIESGLAAARNRVAALQALLAEHGLVISMIELAPLAATTDPQLHEDVVAIRQQMVLVHDLGVRTASLRSGPRRQQSLDLLARGLEAVLARAEALGLDLNIRNAYGTVIEQLDDLHLLWLKINHPRLHVLIDAGEFHESVVNPRDAVRAFGDRLGTIRLGDRKGRRQVPLGTGETNIAAIVEGLHAIGFAGYMVVEPPPAGQSPIEWWSQAREYLEPLLGNPPQAE